MALASTVAAEGFRVTVVDADPNRAYASWAEDAYDGPAVSVHAEADETRFAEAIDELVQINIRVRRGLGDQLAD